MGSTLQQKIAATRRWWRATRVLGGLTWVLSVVIVLGLICYQCDRHLALSASAREAWRTGIELAGVLTLLTALLRPLTRRLPDMTLAADVERRYPVLRERLLTTLDLAPALETAGPAAIPSVSGGSPQSNFSPALAGAVADETNRVAADLDFRRAVSLRPLRNGALTLVFMLVLLALQVAVAGPAFANWLRRMADPHADIAPYAGTRLQVTPDATLLPVGETTSVTIKTWGNIADKCELRIHRQDEPADAWTRITLQNPAPLPDLGVGRDEGNVRSFRYQLPKLAQNVTLVAYANDGHSNERDVRVAARPTVLGVNLTLHYPAYMHRADKTLNGTNGSFAAPYGSEVEVTALTNNPLKAATYLQNNGKEEEWAVSAHSATGRLAIRKDLSYTLKLVDSNGFRNLDAPRYLVHADMDQTPTVQISRPATDLDLVPGGSLPLVARADDDYGVVSMKLVYDKTHEDASRTDQSRISHVGAGSLNVPGPDGGPHAAVQQRWHIASISPRPGDVVRYELDAIDNDTLDGPHIGRSTAYRIHVVSVPEMQMRIKEQLDEEQRALQQLRAHQIQAQQQLLQARLKPTPANLSRAQETQRSVAQETQSATERMQQLSNQLENNAMATKSELERRDQARDTLQNQAQQKMDAAATKVQSAQNEKAQSAAARQNLSQAEQQEAGAKQDIEKAQQLVARTQTPEQLAQEAARLAADQQRLADESRSLAENKDSDQKAGLEMERRQQAQTNADTQRMMQQLNQAAQAAQERGDKQTAQALQRAAQQMQQSQAQANQSKAQQNLNNNAPDKAASPQDKAAAALQKAQEEIQKAANQNQDAPATAAERLEQAAQDLQKMAQEQQKVAAQTGKNPDAAESKALAQKEQSLEQQAQQAQQMLGGSKSAQQSLQNAQQNLNQSGQQLSQNQAKSAQSPAQQAAQQLQNAAQQAARAAQQLRQQQAAQEMAEQVERLAQLQHGLQSATQRLEQARAANNLTGNDMRERRQVAKRQAMAEDQAQNMAEKFPSPAFQRAMKMAAEQMHPATDNLGHDEPNTGGETQAAQGHAAQTLDTIARALKQQAQGGQQSQQQDQQQQQQQQNGSPQQQEEAEALGELMLSQGLQQQLRQDTGTLDQQRAKNQDRSLTPEQQREADRLAHGQREAGDIARRAGEKLQDMPDAQRQVEEATRHMAQAGQNLTQKQTGNDTQGHQDEALRRLEEAVKQAQQQQQQQQQQQMAQQQAQQGAPQPSQQNGNQPPNGPFTKLQKVQNGAMSTPLARNGKGFQALSPRTQRVMREGQNEKVPAEFQDLVNRYYKSLAEKKR
jgi:hypothetical protein